MSANTPIWTLIDGRQRDWIHAAIAYYSARIAIYRLMIREWEDELAEIRASHVTPTSEELG